MRKGRITIPTDESYVEGTKKIADLWGADAVRDCDGVKLPKNPIYGDRYAIINNTNVEQTTVFYDMNGEAQEIVLTPYEIKWIIV